MVIHPVRTYAVNFPNRFTSKPSLKEHFSLLKTLPEEEILIALITFAISMFTIIGKIREKASFFLEVLFGRSDYSKTFIVCLEDIGKIATIAFYEASDIFLTFAVFQD